MIFKLSACECDYFNGSKMTLNFKSDGDNMPVQTLIVQ